MPSQATITAKIGAGQQATALVLTNIRSFSFDCLGNTLNVVLDNHTVRTFAGYTTVTVTLSGSNYTLTVS